MTTPDGVASFDLLALVDSVRGLGEPCSHEQSIISKVAAACPIAGTRAGLALPTLELCRDLKIGTPAAGGNLAVERNPLTMLAGAARPALVFDRAGIESVTINDAQEASLPRWRGDGGGWLTEGQPISPGSLELSTVAVSARHCSACVRYSRRLRLSTSGDLQAAILTELQRQVRQTLEHGLINGTGTEGEPLGLMLQAAGAVSFAALLPTWAELMDMAEALADENGDLANSVWMAHPSTAVAMAGTERVTGSGLFLVEMGAGGSWSIAGVPLVTSTALPEGRVVLMDRRAVEVVFFGPPMLIVDPFSGSQSITGQSTITVGNYADLGVAEPDLVIIGG